MARAGARTQTKRIDDQARAVEMRKRGKTTTEIAEEIGISQSQVVRDLAAVHERWMERRIDATKDTLMSDKLSQMRILEDEYWAGWDRSRVGKTKSRAQKEEAAGKKRERAEKQTESGPGDPRFLDGIHALWREESKLLGLYAPVKVAPTDPSGENEYGELTDAERTRRIIAVLDAARTRRAGQAAGDGQANVATPAGTANAGIRKPGRRTAIRRGGGRGKNRPADRAGGDKA